MLGLFTSTFTEFENKTFVNFLQTKLAQFEILSPKSCTSTDAMDILGHEFEHYFWRMFLEGS